MNANQIQTAAKTVAAKKVKVNPSANLIGMKLETTNEVTVNYRQGKNNVVTCNSIEVVEANPTGRRLTCIFRDAKGMEIMKRRVYKEHFEKMTDKFGPVVYIDEPQA